MDPPASHLSSPASKSICMKPYPHDTFSNNVYWVEQSWLLLSYQKVSKTLCSHHSGPQKLRVSSRGKQSLKFGLVLPGNSTDPFLSISRSVPSLPHYSQYARLGIWFPQKNISPCHHRHISSPPSILRVASSLMSWAQLWTELAGIKSKLSFPVVPWAFSLTFLCIDSLIW